jgi:lipopolysaccharide transport system ATP-binding protein
MSHIVIKAENLGKKYVIGHQAERGGYTALRDVWMQNARTLWNKTKDLAKGKPIIQEVLDNPGYRPSPVRHNTGFM